MKKINLPFLYSQWDSRWASNLLGFNTLAQFNIYNYGCLITCLSMTARYYGYVTDPADLNERLKKLGENVGFQKGDGNYIWGAFKKLFAKIEEEKYVPTPAQLTDAQMNEIKSALDAGYPVMLGIDYNPKTVAYDMHFVLAIGYNPADENDFLIADPLGGTEVSLKKYLGFFKPSARSTIESYTVLKGKVAVTPTIRDTIIDFKDGEGNQHSVGWYVYEWANEKNARTKEADVYNKALTDFKQTVVDLNADKVELENTITKKQTEILGCNEKNKELTQTVLDRDNEIVLLKQQAVSQYTIGELVLLIWEKIKDIKLK